MCGVVLEDFIRPLSKKPISEGRASFYMKLITVVLGVIFVLLAFVVDKLTGLVQVGPWYILVYVNLSYWLN